MADFATCIQQAVKAGKLTKGLADAISQSDNPVEAVNMAAQTLTRQKREAAIQAVRIAEGWKNMNAHPEGLYDGLVGLLTKDPKGKANYANVEYRQRYYQGRYHSKFANALSRFRTRTLGFTQDADGLEKLVRAIYGESVDDAEIAGFARQWADLTEIIRTEFNSLGGSISKNESWLLPQNHDLRSVEKMGLDNWKSFISDKLDRTKMLDDAGQPMTDTQFNESLDFVYETITTGGINKTRDFTVAQGLGTKLSRRGAEKRFLYFKDADSWLEYQKKAGRGDIFTTLTDWVDTKAHDMGLMEVLGVNPENTFYALRNQAQKNKKLTGNQLRQSQAIYNVVSGKTNQGELTGLADFMQTTRNLLTASTLGKAFLSSISDIGFQAMTSRFNGIPAHRTLARQLSMMNPANEADRIAAVKIGLVAEGWLGRAHGANRYSDVYGTGYAAKTAEAVMRSSLLSPWTDAGRKAFGMEFASTLADNFGKQYDQLDMPLRRAMETYGIDSTQWDAFRATEPLVHKGAKFADMTQPGGEKFHQMVLSETDYAVPTPDARVRAITTGGLGRATIEGQAWRSAMMLKSFPITIATTHFYRAAYRATMGEKLGYLGTLVASTTVLGGIAIQAKDIAAGREPRPIDNPAYFAAAFQQGGGLGIFGDFIFSDVNRFGGGITQTLVGPTGELLDTSVKFTLGNVREAVQGEETNVLGEGVRILNRYTPDTWQTYVFSDALFNQIEMMVDDDAEARLNRIVKKRQKDFDQGFWWRPGEIAPEAMQ